MTMPNLIHKNKITKLKIQFQTAYSLISQAVNRMSIDNNNIGEHYCGNNKQTDYYLRNFIPDFSQYFDTISMDNKSYYGKTLGYNDSSQYFYEVGLGTSKFNKRFYSTHGYMVLKNGMIIFSSGCAWSIKNIVDFVVDTNGPKGPNRFGYDVFYFQINDKNILNPSNGTYAVWKEKYLKGCCNFETNSTCVYNDNGTYCALYALKNIFPNDESKTYWDNLP